MHVGERRPVRGFTSPVRSSHVPNYQILGDARLNASGGSGIYTIKKDKKKDEYSLEFMDDSFELPPKIYGNIKWYIEYYWNGFKNMNYQSGLLLTGNPGAGKEIRYTEPVLTPNGWVPIGKLNVGDKVVTWDGNITRVNGVFPQGIKQLYKITFEDGRSVDAGKNHQWGIYKGNNVTRETLNTFDLIELAKTPTEVSIDLVKPFDTEFSESFFSESVIKYSIPKWTKIPDQCKDGNVAQNTMLLKHVVTRYGKLTMNNEILLYLKHRDFRKDIITLVRKLGGICYDGMDVLVICFNDNSCMFDKDSGNYELAKALHTEDTLKLKLQSIEKIDSDEAVCISVDSDDKLYVTRDYIVTHNTEISRSLCNKALDSGMMVILINNVSYTPELIAFLDELDNALLFFDEFGKVFPYRTQGKMLPLLSNTFGRRRICIIADNDLAGISDAIKDRPGRLRYSKDILKLDPTALEEYLIDFPITGDFKIGLISLYKKSMNFVYDHLQALVSEHRFNPTMEFKDILDVLNLSGFQDKPRFILTKLVKIDEALGEVVIDESLIKSVPSVLYKARIADDYIYDVYEMDKKNEATTDDKPKFNPVNDNGTVRVSCNKNTIVDDEPKLITFKDGDYIASFTLAGPDDIVKDDGKNNYSQKYIRG